MTYLGIDLGTSAAKVVLVDEAQAILATAQAPVATARPRPLWSEQDPQDWWVAACAALDSVAAAAPEAMRRVRGIGLSGQMHAATLLDDTDAPVRPAILWNDGRAHAEAAALAEAHPDLARALGVPPMPGFTAPKLVWLARHEPEAMARARTVLPAKDYLRLRLSGERATDRSDAAGTWLLDQARREWSDEALAAAGIARTQLPRLVEGSEAAGVLRPALARRWGLPDGIVLAGGGGDAAAGAVGLGVVDEGTALISLGTSAQLLVASRTWRPAPEALVHAFCHALPGRWTAMAAMLNGASCLAWAAALLGLGVEQALDEVARETRGPSPVLFLPYLSGERTPHDDPHATGVFFGLTPGTSRAEVLRAVLEGVAFTFADAQAALAAAGLAPAAAGLTGGGARSRLWAEILASVLCASLTRYAGGEAGPAFGAARLARLAATGEDPADLCRPPPVRDVIAPDPALAEAYAPRIDRFRALYRALRPEFRR